MRKISTAGILARVLGAILFVFFALFIVGEGFTGPYPFAGATTWQEWAMISLMLVAWLGLLGGFFHECAGGIATVIGMVGWFAIELFFTPDAPRTADAGYWPFYLMLLAGVLFTISGAAHGKSKRRHV